MGGARNAAALLRCATLCTRHQAGRASGVCMATSGESPPRHHHCRQCLVPHRRSSGCPPGEQQSSLLLHTPESAWHARGVGQVGACVPWMGVGMVSHAFPAQSRYRSNWDTCTVRWLRPKHYHNRETDVAPSALTQAKLPLARGVHTQACQTRAGLPPRRRPVAVGALSLRRSRGRTPPCRSCRGSGPPPVRASCMHVCARVCMSTLVCVPVCLLVCVLASVCGGGWVGGCMC